jgi:hypothetical protein
VLVKENSYDADNSWIRGAGDYRGFRNPILHEAWLIMKPTLTTRQGLLMLLVLALGCGLIVWLVVVSAIPVR